MLVALAVSHMRSLSDYFWNKASSPAPVALFWKHIRFVDALGFTSRLKTTDNTHCIHLYKMLLQIGDTGCFPFVQKPRYFWQIEHSISFRNFQPIKDFLSRLASYFSENDSTGRAIWQNPAILPNFGWNVNRTNNVSEIPTFRIKKPVWQLFHINQISSGFHQPALRQMENTHGSWITTSSKTRIKTLCFCWCVIPRGGCT